MSQPPFKEVTLKSLTSLWSCIANEMAIRCCTSATRDITTVVRRTEHEGLSFLAITLADYGKVTQRWLDRGFVVPSEALAFKARPHSGLPAFLSGFLGRVFDPCSGVLLDKPDVEAIFAIRQLTLMFSKIALPTDSVRNQNPAGGHLVVSKGRERRAMSDFIQCEYDVRAADARLDPQHMSDFKRMSAMLFGDVFSKVDRDIYWNRLDPRHGPGATADRLTSNGKWNQRTWPARLSRVFDPGTLLSPNGRYSDQVVSELNVVEPGAETPVRVVTVPKTLKTPRVIAIEPAVMQYLQQAITQALLSAIDEDDFLSRTIGFTDQDPNREMACEGSFSGELATLDLSEASDRVSNQHVRAMLEDWSHLHEAVQSTRSRKADVPGHGVLRLAKFASMGSALCFPIEALVFTTLIFLGIERELSTPLSREALIKRFHGRVRVFGDDLIVPREFVLSVVDELQTFGFVVNTGKSYWTGRFRESCGKEYYDGHDVSIVKVRRVLPSRRQDADGVISAVALRNLLYEYGLWKGAAWMDDYLRKLLKHFPNVAPSSPILGRVSFLGYQFQRLHPKFLSPIVKGYYEDSKSPIDPLDGVGALHKCLWQATDRSQYFFGLPRTKSEMPLAIDCEPVDDEHLERSGRPQRVNIKLGWRPPY